MKRWLTTSGIKEMQIEIKEITLHTYHNGLNKNDTLLDIRSVQNIHGDILPTIKGP